MGNIQIVLSGYNGKMGQEVRNYVNNNETGVTIISGVDKLNSDGCLNGFEKVGDSARCIVDFSTHLLTKELVDFALSRSLPLVIATTGQDLEEVEYIKKASKTIPIFFSANMSLGVNLLSDVIKRVIKALPEAEVEIVETHHSRKVDAPSGTAKMIAKSIMEVRPEMYVKTDRNGKRDKNEIGIQSIRYGNVAGIHEVIISTGVETITLKHEAITREIFAQGAISAARYIVNKQAGLYTMQDLLND